MTNESEKARWAKLAGLPKKETKQQLDENVVGIGAVNQIFPTREPNDYEMAFEHFLGEMYDSKKENVEEDDFDFFDFLIFLALGSSSCVLKVFFSSFSLIGETPIPKLRFIGFPFILNGPDIMFVLY